MVSLLIISEQHCIHEVPAHIVYPLLAVKKSAHNRCTGGRPPKADLTLAEDIALALKKGRPVLEGKPGGTKINVCPSQDAIRFIQGKFFISTMETFKWIAFGLKLQLGFVLSACGSTVTLLEPQAPASPTSTDAGSVSTSMYTWQVYSSSFNMDMIICGIGWRHQCRPFYRSSSSRRSSIWYRWWWHCLSGLQKEWGIMSSLLNLFAVYNSEESSFGDTTKFPFRNRIQTLCVERVILPT